MKYKDEDFLREEYISKEKSSVEIGKELGVSNRTILNWLHKFNIIENSVPQKIDLPEKEIYKLHYEDKVPLNKIAEKYNVSHSKIHALFKSNDWEVKDYQKVKKPSKKTLENLYWNKNLSFVEIAERFNCSNVTVRKWFHEHDIETRSHSENQRRKKKYPTEKEVKKLYIEENKSYKELADIYGVSISVIQRLIERYDIEPNKINQKSSYEKEIIEFLVSLEIKNIITNTKEVISPYEIDIFLPDYSIAIEFNGDYWHSDIRKSQTYHQKKSNLCRQKGIKLIHIFEFEWLFKKNILKSIIKNSLGLNKNIIYARNCEIKKIDKSEASKFLNEYHLQGYRNSRIRYGLFCKQELLSVMTFGKPRFNKKYEWELLRFCNKSNYTIVGGFSKILKKFSEENKPENIISYCNYSLYDGNGYKKLDFKFMGKTYPNYFYVHRYTREKISRYQAQKHKLKRLLKENFFPEKSEYENMKLNNYFRIFDSGNLIFVKEFNQ